MAGVVTRAPKNPVTSGIKSEIMKRRIGGSVFLMSYDFQLIIKDYTRWEKRENVEGSTL